MQTFNILVQDWGKHWTCLRKADLSHVTEPQVIHLVCVKIELFSYPLVDEDLPAVAQIHPWLGNVR